jgi:hypothetical protein
MSNQVMMALDIDMFCSANIYVFLTNQVKLTAKAIADI